ncbi:MAG: GHMP family kinase ATP-binding protein [Gemmatimonadaceae bacterium]
MTWHYRVPGRVELAGKHTDYAGGPSLTCATPMVMDAQVERTGERVLRVRDVRTEREVEVPLSAEAAPGKERWSVYIAAVARRVARDFPGARHGADVELTSAIPSSAGLSSSSALVVSAVMALFDANALWEAASWGPLGDDDLAFAQYCAAVESGAPWGPFAGDTGVGTRGGAQDHIAICASRDGMVGEYSYLPGRVVQRVAWPAEWRIVVLNSGVKATKTGNARVAYNRVADSVRALVAAWNTETGRSDATLADALASSAGAVDRMLALAECVATPEMSADYLRRRLAQYRNETTQVVPQLVDAIARGDAAMAGACLEQSQRYAEAALENQVPQTTWLARSAVELGAAGATAFGAGFGGAVWALVCGGDVRAFAKRWMDAYQREHHMPTSRVGVPRVMRPSAGMQRERA